MIRTETFYKDGVTLVRTWSDIGMYIHGGYPEADYVESVDPVSTNRSFIETDRPIEDWSEPETMVSSRNISAEQYFTVGDKLYYSTATITVGEDIVPDENCIETTVADELNNMKED